MRANHYIIKGRVQGVSFRYSTLRQAKSLNIKGFVRNTHDGNVEVEAVGETASIVEFEKFLFKGPPFANVKDVSCTPLDELPEYQDFIIKY